MLNLILFFIFSAVVECLREVVVEESVIGLSAVPHLHLRVDTKEMSGELSYKPLKPFALLEPLLQICLYPCLGCGELFKLLDMEKEPLAVYKFQKLIIFILADRIKNGCVESNQELCRYLLIRYNNISYEAKFIDQLREWRRTLKTKRIPLADISEQTGVSVTPSLFSKKGKIFLQSKSGVRDHQLSDKVLMQEYMKLPKPLQRAVCIDVGAEKGGRIGFDTCCDELYGFSLRSAVVEQAMPGPGRPPKLHAAAEPVIVVALQRGESRSTVGSWFGVGARAVGYWISRKFSDTETNPLITAEDEGTKAE
jgi:hypothetical protein